MLFGYALENLTKGIIFCREPDLITSTALQRLGSHGHGLAYLFDRAGISLTEDERKVLDRTTRLTVWKGKYPVPLKFSDTGLEDPMLGYIAFSGTWPPDEYINLTALYDRVKAELIKTMEAVPPLTDDHNFTDK
jgi:hypothetical protein